MVYIYGPDCIHANKSDIFSFAAVFYISLQSVLQFSIILKAFYIQMVILILIFFLS